MQTIKQVHSSLVHQSDLIKFDADAKKRGKKAHKVVIMPSHNLILLKFTALEY